MRGKYNRTWITIFNIMFDCSHAIEFVTGRNFTRKEVTEWCLYFNLSSVHVSVELDTLWVGTYTRLPWYVLCGYLRDMN